MANALYDKGREAFLTGAINWTADTIKIALIDTGTYTVNLATHQFLTSLTGVVSTAQTLGTKTATDGVADAADVTFPTVTGTSVEALVIYKDTGTAGTSALIAYIDTGTGLPVTPNGGDIIVVFDNGANKIFKL
jgi:hypothetical protein